MNMKKLFMALVALMVVMVVPAHAASDEELLQMLQPATAPLTKYCDMIRAPRHTGPVIYFKAELVANVENGKLKIRWGNVECFYKKMPRRQAKATRK